MPRPWKKQFNISPPPNTMELRDHTFNAPIFVLFDDSCKYKVHTSAGTFNDTLMMIDAVPFPSNWNELYLYFVRVVRTDVDQFRARNFQKHICSFTLLGNVTKIHTFDYLTTWLLDYLTTCQTIFHPCSQENKPLWDHEPRAYCTMYYS